MKEYKGLFLLGVYFIAAYLLLQPFVRAGVNKNVLPKTDTGKIEMVFQVGHSQSVTSLAFSPDGKYLISAGGYENIIKLWNTSGHLLRNFTDHAGFVGNVAFHPSGNFFAAGSHFLTARRTENNTVTFWDVKGAKLKSIRLPGTIGALVFSSDGKYLAAGMYGDSVKPTIVLFDKDGNIIRNIKLDLKLNRITGLAIRPDSKALAVACEKEILVLNLQGEVVNRLVAPEEGFGPVAFSRNGNFIAVGHKNKTVILWDKKSRIAGIYTGPTGSIDCIAFGPDETLAAGCRDNKIYRWRSDGTLADVLEGHKDFVYTIDINAGGMLASGSLDKTVRLWSSQGKQLRVFDAHPEVKECQVLPTADGKFIVHRGRGEDIAIWSTTGNLVRTIKNAHQKGIYNLALTADNRYIVSLGKDHTLRYWNFDGTLARNLKVQKFTKCFALSSDNNCLALAKGRQLSLYSQSGQLIFSKKTEKEIRNLAFSPDSKMLAALGSFNGIVQLWTLDGKQIQSGKDTRWTDNGIAFSPDGTHLASWGNDSSDFKLWDLKGGADRLIGVGPNIFEDELAGKKVRDYKNNLIVYAMAFSSDGKYLASGGKDKKVHLWKSSGDLLKTLKGHDLYVQSVAFSPNNKQVISSGSDNTIKLWNVNDDYQATLIAQGNEWIIYTPDGYFDCSQNGGQLVNMVDGMTVYGADQLAPIYNRPDVILARLGHPDEDRIAHYLRQYQRRLRRMGINKSESLLTLHVPETRILNAQQKDKFVEVTFKISDRQYALKSYNIYVNDVPLYGAYGKHVTGQKQTLKQQLELTTGENKIEVTCMNVNGAESFRAATRFIYDQVVQGDLYFIGFGVSKYMDESINLKYADKDVLDLANIFKAAGKRNFGNVYIKTFVNEAVTNESIKQAKQLLKHAKVDDTFVLFIAGHGVHDTDIETTYYYLTHNADINDLAGTCAKFDLVEDLLQGVPPRNKLFLMDTCESGEIEETNQERYYAKAAARGIKPRTIRGIAVISEKKKPKKQRPFLFEKDRYVYNDLIRRSGAIVFSSSKGGEFSYESDKIANGYFTEAIMKAMVNGATDTNADGLISTDELRAYVAKDVALATEDLQHPTVDRDNIYQKFGFPAIEQ